MPYIDRPKRPSLDEALEPVLKKIALGRSKGEMVYLFYRMGLAWIRQQGQSFDSISEAKAALRDTGTRSTTDSSGSMRTRRSWRMEMCCEYQSLSAWDPGVHGDHSARAFGSHAH
jgi:hypothetical protein